MSIQKRPKVVVVYKNMPHYRVAFFELLRKELEKDGVNFVLIYGQPSEKDKKKKDTIELDWAVKIKNKIIKIGNRELYWQPCFKYIKDADLVIVEQASKLLINYFLLVLNKLKMTRLAYWGHGKNFQDISANFIAEKIKVLLSNKVHWWFAYNNTSKRAVMDLNFPESRITNVQNTIDTKSLLQHMNDISQEELDICKKELNLIGNNVALYAGGMYKEKRLDFLLDACKIIKKNIPDFEMIFIGGGIDDYKVKQASEENDWIKYVGPKFSREKTKYFMLSKIQLMPGLVGLGVIDSFAYGVPMVTTNISYHSPEIEYLENGENGIIVSDPDDLEEYAESVIRLLKDDYMLEKLKNGCSISKRKYTNETMVNNFRLGVLKALEVK